MPLPAPPWILKQLLAPALRPLTRLIIGALAIPLFRLLRRKLVRDQKWTEEFEKDVEQWFRASVLLLFATKNMELKIGEFFSLDFNQELLWYIAAGRIMLAIGVVETMPDQQLFSIIYPGPPRLTWDRQLGVWQNIQPQIFPFVKGVLCQHLNRSSPVFAIMSTIFDGWVGWTCYWIAIIQYLIIGLVTSRDKALDVLSEFDRQVAMRREELIEEFYDKGGRGRAKSGVARATLPQANSGSTPAANE